MKKIVTLMFFSFCLCLISQALNAACLCAPYKADVPCTKAIENSKSTYDIYVKTLNVINSQTNKYDPSDGDAYVLGFKYETPEKHNLKLGLGLYGSGNISNMTDFNTSRVSRGMFVTQNGGTKFQLGEHYLRYNLGNSRIYAGRMKYSTPLTTNVTSLMPTFYTVFGFSSKVSEDLKLGIAHISQMSMGGRTMTDFGLIGEGTTTGGIAIKPSTVGQAQFHDISITSLGRNASHTSGIMVYNAEYTGMKNFKLSLFDYYVSDIANNIYFQADTSVQLKCRKLYLSGQFLSQTEVGDDLAGNLDYKLFGVKASVKNKKWNAFVAFNKSTGNTGMFNAWGGDPGFTSSLFSRNEYREDVTSYMIGGKYKIRKNVILATSYGRYSQSDTLAPAKVLKAAATGFVSSQKEANELDMILTWKISKHLTVKLCHALRTSEYDGVNGKDLTMQHSRLIGVYRF